jgi:hypothetical protein
MNVLTSRNTSNAFFCDDFGQGAGGSHVGSASRSGMFHLSAQRRASDGNIRDQTT